MNDKQITQLELDGYLLLKNVVSTTELINLRARLEKLWEEEGQAAGIENYIEPDIRRLANLANKGNIFIKIYSHADILEIVEFVMGPEIRLSMLNARDVPPQTGATMPYHCDTDNATKQDELGFNACTAIWMLDDFTVENGATRLVPGSHLFEALPKEGLQDLYAVHPKEIIVEGQAGDVLVFNGHCWHAGRPNNTDGHRRAILAHYLRADIPHADNRRQHIPPEIAASLGEQEKELLGLNDQ